MTELNSDLRDGGHILVDGLKVHGVDRIFCVPGESYLAVLNALYDARDCIDLVSCRNEGGAAFMAEACGKLTGKPGICMVTRGPGATNASIGVHTAFQDSTPMIMFIGQVSRKHFEREAFQEIDYRQMFGPMTKWVAQIDDAARIPEFLSRAFHVATSGRPGPVVLALPEDMLAEEVSVLDAGPYKAVMPSPNAEDLNAVWNMLSQASRPMVIAGGGGWNSRAKESLEKFAQVNNLPVGCAFRRQDCFDNTHQSYIGDIGLAVNPKLAQRIKDADLIIAIGPRLGECTTGGYRLLSSPNASQSLIHVFPCAEELNRVYKADIAVIASAESFLSGMNRLPPVDHELWGEWCAAAKADYVAHSTIPEATGDLTTADIVRHVRDSLPKDSIVTNGAGNYTVPLHRFYRYKQYGTQLAPTSGAMGYGVPAAVAAKLVYPNRAVVSFSGDGCFMMNGQELATAVQYKANVIFLVINNGRYGTIRMHQERLYPDRVVGTDLVNPDFAAMAKAFGANGEIVESEKEFKIAFERALRADAPSLLEIRVK